MKTVTQKSSHRRAMSQERAGTGAPNLLDRRDGSFSQSSIDNSLAVAAQRMQIEGAFGKAIQRQPLEEEEEEPLQGKFATLQRQPVPEEEEEELLQGRFVTGADTVIRRKGEPHPNRTGLPDELKAGVESLSGLSLDDVRVHYNSSRPAELQALAYTRGSEIHVAPGQERHLPHEAWHVVQQMEGRVQPTTQVAEMAVNDDLSLESEADVMGTKALQMSKTAKKPQEAKSRLVSNTIQCVVTDADAAFAAIVALPVAVNRPDVNVVVVPDAVPLGFGGNPAIFVRNQQQVGFVTHGMEAYADEMNVAAANRQVIAGRTVVIHQDVLARPRAMRAAIIWHEYGHAVTGAAEPGAYRFEVTQLILAAHEGQFTNAEVTAVLAERLPQYEAGMTPELRQMLEGWTWD